MCAPRAVLNQKGFTLLETLVSVSISVVILLSVFAVITMASTIFRTNELSFRVDQTAMQTLRSISREIGQTSPKSAPSHLKITTDGSGNSVVRFQIPVDHDNDGDADTGGLNPQAEWGAYDTHGSTSGGRLGGWTRYSVNAQRQLVRDVLDSSLTVISSESKVLANNVQTFSVSKSLSTVTMTMLVRETDTIGQKGASSRNIQATFSTSTLLRNAVS